MKNNELYHYGVKGMRWGYNQASVDNLYSRYRRRSVNNSSHQNHMKDYLINKQIKESRSYNPNPEDAISYADIIERANKRGFYTDKQKQEQYKKQMDDSRRPRVIKPDYADIIERANARGRFTNKQISSGERDKYLTEKENAARLAEQEDRANKAREEADYVKSSEYKNKL